MMFAFIWCMNLGMVPAIWEMGILAWELLCGEPAMWGVVGMGNAPSRKCANRRKHQNLV